MIEYQGTEFDVAFFETFETAEKHMLESNSSYRYSLRSSLINEEEYYMDDDALILDSTPMMKPHLNVSNWNKQFCPVPSNGAQRLAYFQDSEPNAPFHACEIVLVNNTIL